MDLRHRSNWKGKPAYKLLLLTFQEAIKLGLWYRISHININLNLLGLDAPRAHMEFLRSVPTLDTKGTK
jgi:hypothetical protein